MREIDVFPDLSNTITGLYLSEDGRRVTAEALISGTQAKDGFGIPNLSPRYEPQHVFIIHGSAAGIEDMKAYWDNAARFHMLGEHPARVAAFRRSDSYFRATPGRPLTPQERRRFERQQNRRQA